MQLPSESQILSNQNTDGELLSWKTPSNLPFVIFSILFVYILIVGGIFIGKNQVLCAWQSLNDGQGIAPHKVIWLSIWFIVLISMLWFNSLYLYIVIRGRGKSEMLLGHNDMKYLIGWPTVVSRISEVNNKNKLLIDTIKSLGKPIFAKKHEINNLQSARVNETLRLTFDIGNRRYDIGKFLPESEKEWLYRKLESWLK